MVLHWRRPTGCDTIVGSSTTYVQTIVESVLRSAIGAATRCSMTAARFLVIDCGDPLSMTEVGSCGTAVGAANGVVSSMTSATLVPSMPLFRFDLTTEAATSGEFGVAAGLAFLSLTDSNGVSVAVTGVALASDN